VARGVPAGLVARVVPRLAFGAEPVAEDLTAQWLDRLLAPDAPAAAARLFGLFDSGEALAPDSALAAFAD
jgi:hypothetical protein